MRTLVLLACTTMLAACGGAGPQSAGTSAPPAGAGGGGNVAGGGGGNDGTLVHTFVDPTEPKSYTAVGSSHSYQYLVENPGTAGAGQGAQLYQGDASTVRNSGLTIAFNPRDAIFDVSFRNGLAGTSTESRFQDPLHRTDFGGAIEPQIGTPNLGSAQWNIPDINYLEAGSLSNVFTSVPGEFAFDLIDRAQGGSYNVATFFYQTPGSETQYVTFAGYLRNQAAVSYDEDNDIIRQTSTYERGAFAYGELTSSSSVPATGTGTFTGRMLASMVFNDQPGTLGNSDTYFQWVAGQATASVDFGANTFALSLEGTAGAPLFDGTSRRQSVLEGAQFRANGGGDINLVTAGGWFGQFNEAWFVNPGGARLNLVIAGSSIDGAFYGPNAEELGGGYRIVGGTPDERIDILGTFVGAQD